MSDKKIVTIGQAQPPDLLLREQLAAQVVAVMQSHFSRPDIDEMLAILHCAKGQIGGAPKGTP